MPILPVTCAACRLQHTFHGQLGSMRMRDPRHLARRCPEGNFGPEGCMTFLQDYSIAYARRFRRG